MKGDINDAMMNWVYAMAPVGILLVVAAVVVVTVIIVKAN